MSWLKGLTDSLGLTSTGPSAATLEQIKNAPIGTQSLGEQRVSSFDEDLQKAFKPLVRGWQPGQAPLTQDQYDRIQAASLDLFDKLGMTSPMGAQPSRVMAASMRKAVRPPPKTYAEAKTPAAQEVEFQHASPHKFSNVDEANPYGKFDESHLLKGEGATVYGPGAAYVSTAEPTHRHYMNQFARTGFKINPTDVSEKFPDLPKAITPNELARSANPNSLYKELQRRANTLTTKLNEQEDYLKYIGSSSSRQEFIEQIASAKQELAELSAGMQWLTPKLQAASWQEFGFSHGPYSYRGSLAEDPARTVLFDKPLSEQLPKVQAALARSSSQARKDIVPQIVPGAKRLVDAETGVVVHSRGMYPDYRSGIRAYFEDKFSRNLTEQLQREAKTLFEKERPNLGYPDGTTWEKLNESFPQHIDIFLDRVLKQNPALAKQLGRAEDKVYAYERYYRERPDQVAKLPGLAPELKLQASKIRTEPREIDYPATQKNAGEYLRDAKATPKQVQKIRDAGIDLIKYGGSSESPNYVVVNPAAAKIRQRTPGIAATFGTGELARQLYESIYGKDAQ